MLCSNCKKRVATVSEVHNTNGNVEVKNLCALCAEIEKRASNQSFNEAVSLGFPIMWNGKRGKKTCSSCGTTIEQLQNTGFVGCSNCYKVFSEEMKSILLRMHGASTHKKNISNDKTGKISRLNCELELAIKERRAEDIKALGEKLLKLREEGK